MPDALAVAPLGQRYMLALAAIGDDENPVDARKEVMPHHEPNVHSERHNATPPETGAVAPLTVCPKCGGLGSLPYPSPRFLASERGKARYASASDMERARTRAALLPKDARFIKWAIEHGADVNGLSYEDATVFFIQNTCCAGESRKLIAEDETCYEAFLRMETQYFVDTNQMAEPR
jgi:hypothetical protein